MDFDFTTTGDLVTLQLYKNKRVYPQYSDSLTSVGTNKEVTPRNINLPEGFIDVDISYSDLTTANYIRLTRSGFSFYAFITRFEHLRGDKLYRLYYKVDAFRTYKNKIDFGNQFIVRSPQATDIYDKFLGGDYGANDTYSFEYAFPNADKRVLVVQSREPTDESLVPDATPVQPSPYLFYFCEYDVNNWAGTASLFNLFTTLNEQAETLNIVTMYSLPFFDLSTAADVSLPIEIPNDNFENRIRISGFKRYIYGAGVNMNTKITQRKLLTVMNDLTKTNHKIMVVVPEAGVMEIPDEALIGGDLYLRQDVDIFSGACNYMLESESSTSGLKHYHVSIRGSAINNIPIISDPLNTYLSQNQNGIATSLLGDVATIAGGAIAMSSGVGAGIGFGMVGSGVMSMVGSAGNAKDASSHVSNPPAFLGSALAPNFNQKFWLIHYYTHITNAHIVHEEIGYPLNLLTALEIPSVGYIQTQNCGVKSTDGTVPLWAIEEINNLLDNGLKVET